MAERKFGRNFGAKVLLENGRSLGVRLLRRIGEFVEIHAQRSLFAVEFFGNTTIGRFGCDEGFVVTGRRVGLATLYRSYEGIPVRAAVRFPLHLEIVLHAATREYPGVTEDVSANGLLFSADTVPEVGTEVRFEMTMPAAVMGGANDVLLNCSGRIIRHQQLDDKLMAAAVIDEYSLRG